MHRLFGNSILLRIFTRVAMVQMVLLIATAITIGAMSRWSDDPELAGATIALRILEQDIVAADGQRPALPANSRIFEVSRNHPAFWAIARNEFGALHIGPAPEPQSEPVIDAALRTSASLIKRTATRPPMAYSSRDGVTLLTGPYQPSTHDKSMFLISLWPEIAGLGALQLLGVAFALLLVPCDIRLALQPVMAAISGSPRDGVGLQLQSLGPRELQPMLGLASEAITALQRDKVRHRNYSGDVAHELLTPLAAMRHRVETLDDGPTRRALEADLTRMAEAVRALLELAVADDRNVTLPVCDLARTAREAVAERAPLCLADGQRIAFEGPESGVPARASAALVRCLLLNLIDNAARHSGSNWILVTLDPAGLIEVADGGWIAPESRERLQERLVRGQGAQQGSGLGLALVRQIAARHDAALSIADADGRHTVVRIDFRSCLIT